MFSLISLRYKSKRMNNIMYKYIAFTPILFSFNVIASESNPFMPYKYIEEKSSVCEKLDPVEHAISESGKPQVGKNLVYIAKVDGVDIYFDSSKDVYIEISDND